MQCNFCCNFLYSFPSYFLPLPFVFIKKWKTAFPFVAAFSVPVENLNFFHRNSLLYFPNFIRKRRLRIFPQAAYFLCNFLNIIKNRTPTLFLFQTFLQVLSSNVRGKARCFPRNKFHIQRLSKEALRYIFRQVLSLPPPWVRLPRAY